MIWVQVGRFILVAIVLLALEGWNSHLGRKRWYKNYTTHELVYKADSILIKQLQDDFRYRMAYR